MCSTRTAPLRLLLLDRCISHDLTASPSPLCVRVRSRPGGGTMMAMAYRQANKIPSVDTLNFVMESLACGHTVMGHRDAHEAMVAVAGTVTLEEINALSRSMLTFASDYGHEAEVGFGFLFWGGGGKGGRCWRRTALCCVCVCVRVRPHVEGGGGGGRATHVGALARPPSVCQALFTRPPPLPPPQTA